MRDLERLAASPVAAMSTSCPFLDKLAPETRVKIYGYALTFDTPIKHSKNMQPFLRKITGKQNIESTTDAPLEATTYTESGVATTNSLHRINTSILSTNKLIYKESIAVFYENNVIHFNAQEDLEEEDIVHSHATDLSLATQVITRADAGWIPATGHFMGVTETCDLVFDVFPRIFPKLRTRTAYLYTDSTPNPLASLFGTAQLLRGAPIFESVSFEAVGALIAIPIEEPGMKVFVQSKGTMERWDFRDPQGHNAAHSLVAEGLYLNSRVTAKDYQDTIELANMLFTSSRINVVPEGYPDILYDSHEFWTVVDESLREHTWE